MKRINITKDGVIEYYGNRAGYVKGNQAIVDEMFKRDDIREFLENENISDIRWSDNVYDKLIHNEIEDSIMLRMCRIHQLKPNVDIRMKFIGYDELKERGFGEPDMDNYRIVYDGNIGTNDLDSIFNIFNRQPLPKEYEGHSLSISDVIELYDDESSDLYYVDRVGYAKLVTDDIDDEQVIADKSDEKSELKQQPEPKPIPEPVSTEPEPVEFQVETFRISM